LAKILIEPIHTHFVARTILDIAKTTDTSLIVIGAHGMNKIREFLLGSVLHEVVRNARQHVLLIHAHNNASDHKQENQAACPLLFLISSLPP
jgi:K+-sensing histidine kinase KdpD